MSNFKDHFSGHAEGYASFRPTYPESLFACLASCCQQHELAWDCATGNAQAACSLLPHFDRVVATDASARQIASAAVAANLELRVAAAEASGLASGSVDLVTVAQALHWFDIQCFFAEADRVLRPGGVLAYWCYTHCQVDASCDAIIQQVFAAVEPYWPPERQIVEDGYAGIKNPFHPLQDRAPGDAALVMTANWTARQMLGYMRTWSASQAYRRDQGSDPTRRFATALGTAWGNAARPVRWPIKLYLGRK